MDLLKSIKNKSDYFSNSEENQGIYKVVSHIEIAERHYESGKKGDDYYFNDVIYRCNQAFEGALKEAYRIITRNDPENLTPHRIEKYFEENSVLKGRVLALFTNYRMEWRNKSTHDYKLYFSEQEAFLAIVSISAFISILFDQMLEKNAYEKEKIEIESGQVEKISIDRKDSLLENTIELLKWFSKVIPTKASGATTPALSEREVIGSLYAYVNELAGDIKAIPEFEIKAKDGKGKYYADFYFQRKNEHLLIEVKKYHGLSKRQLSDGTDQLATYMATLGINKGVLYIPPVMSNVEMAVERIELSALNRTYEIVQIYPKVWPNQSN